MEIKSKTTKKNERLFIEIPKCVRDNFEIGEEIIIDANNNITTIKKIKEYKNEIMDNVDD